MAKLNPKDVQKLVQKYKDLKASKGVKENSIKINLDDTVKDNRLREELNKGFKSISEKLDLLDVVIGAIGAIKIPQTKIPDFITVRNLRDLPKTELNVDLGQVEALLTEIRADLKNYKLPTEAKKAIAVRLSNGEEFYEAIAKVVTQGIVGGGGGTPKVKSTTNPQVYAVPVVNPDGSDISGSSSGGDASAANQVLQTALLTTIDADTSNISTKVDTIAGDTTDIETATESIDNKTPALGQALAAASSPVVLTAAQLSTLTPPAAITGFATSAKQDDQTTLLTTIAGDTTDIETATEAINAKMVTGTDIGDVTINNASGGSAVNIQDGGNTITVDGTVAVTGVATETTLGSLLTSSQLIDDTIVTLGTDTYAEATTKGQTIGVVRRDADTTLVGTINEIGPLQMDANGRLKVEAFSGETLPVSLTSTTITGTVAATQSGTWDEVGINDSGNSITVDYATTGSGTATGALRVELPTNGTGVIATVGAVTAITNALPAGTNAIGKLAANSGVDIGDVDITSIAAGDNNIGNVDIVSGTITTVSTLTNQSQEGGVAISLNAGAVDTGTRRVVQANGAGKTILSKGGSASSSGDNTLVAAGSARLKVFAFSLSTVSTTAVTAIFQSGASGTELWRVILQTPASVAGGANLTVTPPAWIFATASATLLNLNLSAAVAVNWSVSYFDEA